MKEADKASEITTKGNHREKSFPWEAVHAIVGQLVPHAATPGELKSTPNSLCFSEGHKISIFFPPDSLPYTKGETFLSSLILFCQKQLLESVFHMRLGAPKVKTEIYLHLHTQVLSIHLGT